jgi:glucose-6-phosphate-specific signal transduction histidine kinase
MTSIAATTTGTTPTTPTTSVRVGLALSIILGLANLPVLFLDVDWGANVPPYALLLLNAALGLVSVVCAAIAWNSGNRLAIRINVAALIVNTIMIVPGLFFEGPVWMPVLSAVTIVLTVIAVVLMMRRTSALVPVID